MGKFAMILVKANILFFKIKIRIAKVKIEH